MTPSVSLRCDSAASNHRLLENGAACPPSTGCKSALGGPLAHTCSKPHSAVLAEFSPL